MDRRTFLKAVVAVPLAATCVRQSVSWLSDSEAVSWVRDRLPGFSAIYLVTPWEQTGIVLRVNRMARLDGQRWEAFAGSAVRKEHVGWTVHQLENLCRAILAGESKIRDARAWPGRRWVDDEGDYHERPEVPFHKIEFGAAV